VIYSIGNRRVETVEDEYFVAPDAQVIGSVRLGRGASVWFSCVIRADSDWIQIGDASNVQDGTIIHTDEGFPTEIGARVTVGHGALLHSCYVGDGTLIASRAMILDKVRIGRDCVIAAGALVPPGRDIPDRSVVMGSPGQIVRSVTERDLAMMRHAVEHYEERAREYRQSLQIDPRSRSA
jgi:carbonic anhydrase/acetyltransferase-like protein (isoleucine patch superfamily)